MREWITVELLLGTLLVTTFTSVGLLALWTATSPRHWFVRTAVLLAVLSPLLLIPAHEVFGVFAIQSAMVTIGTVAYRKSIPRPHFSLSASLLMTALFAISIPIAIRMPALNGYAWATVVLNGVAGGLSTLIGVWFLVGRRKWLVWPAGVISCMAIGVALSMLDWFFPSIVNWTGWPPNPTASTLPTFGTAKRPIIAWLFIPILVAIAILFLTAWWRAMVAQLNGNSKTGIRRLSKPRFVLSSLVFSSFVAIFATMPLYILYVLLTPDSIPEAILPNPNGYDDLIAAARSASSTGFNGLNFDYDTASKQALAVEIAKCGTVYDRVARALSRETRVPLDYSFSGGALAYPDIGNLRSVARAIAAKARLAEMEGRFGDAAQSCLDGISVGQAVARGGLLIDALVGNACAGINVYWLYHERDEIPVQDIGRCIARLQEFDAAIEPYDDVWYRDRVWSQRTNGWQGHLQQLLDDMVKQTWDFLFIRSDEYPAAYELHRVKLRLLILELALRRYHDEQDCWPAAIEELSPKYISVIPIDPFDPKRLSLKYRRTDTGYIAYSVGPNRVDDGGKPPDEDDFAGTPQTGDFRLDVFFKDESTNDGNSSAVSGSRYKQSENTGSNDDDL